MRAAETAAPPPDRQESRGAAIGMLALTVAMYGSAWPVMKVGIHASTPFMFAMSRGVIAFAVSTALLVALRRFAWPTRADWPVITSIGLFQIGIFFALATTGLQFLPAGRSSVLAYTVTLWVVPLARLFLKERLVPRQWLGFGLGIVGLVVLLGPWSIDWRDHDVMIGSALMLTAALCWAIGILHIRGHRWRLSPLQMMPWQSAVAAVFLIVAGLLIEPAPYLSLDPATLGALAWLGLVVGPIGSWTAVEVAKRLPASASSLGFLGTPVLGVIGSTVWLGEPVGADLIAGGLLVLIGVALMLVRGPKPDISQASQ